ncbi:MAG TPA: cation:proton antiporter [Edaphocola sp.]|nr:cation:proton antiporter [Edaphocola sp.]
MTLLADLNFSLPFTNPVIIFSLVLFIILFAPILLNKIKVPHIIGLIIAGIIVGPYGFNLLSRDSSIVLFGTVGLLYIMFLAGLEIDMAEFKKNTLKSLLLGLYTFIIPISIGFAVSYYFLAFSLPTSILLASTFASHTLVTYPLISKYGLANNRAVTITVGATMITDLLTLLVLAVIVGMAQGSLTPAFWTRLSISVILASAIIIFIFPVIARWFFKRFEDGIGQYIFVLAMVFMGGFLAELAGIEAIIGAFLAGLALNKFIPHNSALMNRIGFVGNALFIPFFLVGVGMLVNIRAAFMNWETIKVAAIMIGGALTGKFLACFLAEKTFKLSRAEGSLIFGLSSAQAAATLATVLVGYNVILGETPSGEPIRLLNENILNGSILLILVSCTVSSFVVERSSKKLVAQEGSEDHNDTESTGKTLISVNNPESIGSLVDLGMMITPKKSKEALFAVNVVEADEDKETTRKSSEKMLNAVRDKGAGSDVEIKTLTRFDKNVPNGILFTCREHKITDLILGVTTPNGIQNKKIGATTAQILASTNETVYVYNPIQPFNTLKKIVVAVNMHAEMEDGFSHWVNKLFMLSRESGLPLSFYAGKSTERSIQIINNNTAKPLTLGFNTFEDWDDFLIVGRELNANDLLIIISSRAGYLTYHKKLEKTAYYLSRYFQKNSNIVIYPQQTMSYSKLGDLHQEEGNLIDLFTEGRKMAERAGSMFNNLWKNKSKPNREEK